MSAAGPVQFGIVGAGRIAAKAFAPALEAAANAELAAVASRDLDRARSLKPKRAYDRYEALMDDADVEAVYIATHNGLHHRQTIQALERGKHVLCEKPLACNPTECREMIEAAREHKRLLVEAFMYRYHPQIAKASSLLQSGVIGEVKTVEASFSYLHGGEDDVRFNAAWAGGGLFDTGCYCVNVCRYFLGGIPEAVTAMAAFHPVHNVDVSLHGVLDFGHDRFGIISCGFNGGLRKRVSVCGTKGTLTLPRAFAGRTDRTTLSVEVGSKQRKWSFKAADVFRLEIEDLARAVRGGPSPMLEPEEGWRNARVIEALLQSARDGGARTTVVKG